MDHKAVLFWKGSGIKWLQAQFQDFWGTFRVARGQAEGDDRPPPPAVSSPPQHQARPDLPPSSHEHICEVRGDVPEGPHGGEGAASPVGLQHKSPPPLSSQRALDARAPLFRERDQAMGGGRAGLGLTRCSPPGLERRRLIFRVKDSSVALLSRRRQHGAWSGNS